MFDCLEMCKLEDFHQLAFILCLINPPHLRTRVVFFLVTEEAEKVIATLRDPHEHTSTTHENLPLVDIFRSLIDGSDRCTVEVQSRVCVRE